jgi:hypothetical protein
MNWKCRVQRLDWDAVGVSPNGVRRGSKRDRRECFGVSASVTSGGSSELASDGVLLTAAKQGSGRDRRESPGVRANEVSAGSMDERSESIGGLKGRGARCGFAATA